MSGTMENEESDVSTTPSATAKEKHHSSSNLTDKLIDRMVAAALPSTVDPNDLDTRIQRQRGRPPFSIQLTSRNFRKMTSRVGIVYEVYYLVNEFFGWKNPALTLTVLSIYSFVCLNPRIILTLPSAGILLWIMVPAYSARHPPPPSELQSNPVVSSGPPLKPPAIPKPVPDFSREFFLNMVDTQNAMHDFVVVYDSVVSMLSSIALFANDETRSSLVYTVLSLSTVLAYMLAPVMYEYVPWRIVFLLIGWTVLAFRYPFNNEDTKRHIYTVNNKVKDVSYGLSHKIDDISRMEFGQLDPLEHREVEVFEVQWFNSVHGQWDPSVYINDPFVPSNFRPTAPQPPSSCSLSEILPPVDWVFSSKHWDLDYTPISWVTSRQLTHLFEIDDDEKWVYDIERDHPTWRRRRWINTCTRKSK